mgnify:CR=1 FL=1|jgi:hypothetical protein
MFQAYKEFITRSVEVLFNHPIGASFGDYIQSVLGLMLMLLSAIAAIGILVFISYFPFFIYEKLIKSISEEIDNLNEETHSLKKKGSNS